MRKTFMTKEYSLDDTYGTMNMREVRNFMSSKILEIEDYMRIDNIYLEYTEAVDGSQNLKAESVNKTYNAILDKSQNHTLNLAFQTDEQAKEYTSWDFKINIKELIVNYIYAQLKTARTFKYVNPANTISKNMETAIKQYISYNVMPRIEFDKIELFVKYYSIDNNNLRFNNHYNSSILDLEYETITNFRLVTDSLWDYATMTYKQTKSSEDYRFDYYFNVIWKKS